MNEHGAVPLEPPQWVRMLDEGATYEEIKREVNIDLFCEFWRISGEELHEQFIGGRYTPDDPEQVRLMGELLIDGADEDVIMALLPGRIPMETP